MRVAAGVLMLWLALLFAGAADAADDARYCGPPKRDEDGVIVRSRAVLREFQRIYACPSTGRYTGACPGWYRDHVVPLVCGGCDAIENLQWLPAEIKTCRGLTCKDRFERVVYCRAPPEQPPTEPTTDQPTGDTP